MIVVLRHWWELRQANRLTRRLAAGVDQLGREAAKTGAAMREMILAIERERG